MGRPPAYDRLLVLLVLTDVAATGFILAILLGLGDGDLLHEVAGLVLLVLLVLAIWSSLRLRPADPRLVRRSVTAAIALVLAGVLGASLALGSLGGDLAGLPLVPLAAVLVATSDGIRLIVRDPTPTAPRP